MRTRAQLVGTAYTSLVQPVGPIEIFLLENIPQRTLVKLRQAMKLFGKASQIELELWNGIPRQPKVRGPPMQPGQVDARAFRAEDLTPSFVIEWGPMSDIPFPQWLRSVEVLLDTERDIDDPTFEHALHQLSDLEALSGKPVGQCQLPVSLRVVQSHSPDVAALAASLASVSRAQPSAHRVSLKVECVDVSIERLDDATLEELLRIQACNIAIRHIKLAEVHISGFSPNFAPLTAPLLVSPLQSLLQQGPTTELCTAVLNGPRDIHLLLGASSSPDWLLLCRALRLASFRPGKRFFDFTFPRRVGSLGHVVATASATADLVSVHVDRNTADGSALSKVLSARSLDSSIGFKAIVGTTNALLKLPNSDELMQVTPDSIVETPSLDSHADTDTRSTATEIDVRLSIGSSVTSKLPTVVAFLKTCFGDRLTSLDLEIQNHSRFTAPKFASTLAAFPSLTCLKLSRTELTSMSVFLDAYGSGPWRLRVLSITSGHAGFVPSFEELTSPTSSVAKTLEELRLGFPQGRNSAKCAFLEALTRTLIHNQSLRVLEALVAAETEVLLQKISSRGCRCQQSWLR